MKTADPKSGFMLRGSLLFRRGKTSDYQMRHRRYGRAAIMEAVPVYIVIHHTGRIFPIPADQRPLLAFLYSDRFHSA